MLRWVETLTENLIILVSELLLFLRQYMVVKARGFVGSDDK